MKKLMTKKGFTLIELMIVVAIIGILAAIAIPQFANLVAKSQEGRCKANLGTIRSALSIYYGDLEGWYPTKPNTLDSLTLNGRYLQVMPSADLPKTSNSAGHAATPQVTNAAPVEPTVGGWYYNNNTAALGAGSWGQILVNCVHQDLRASVWSTY